MQMRNQNKLSNFWLYNKKYDHNFVDFFSVEMIRIVIIGVLATVAMGQSK